MKKYFLTTGLVLFSLIAFAAKVEDKGKEWLDAQKDPPAVNVTGDWNSPEWGAIHLTQAEGSRDVSGTAPGYEVVGAVSAKKLYMLFANKSGNVDYCATLNSESDNRLTGSYADRVTRLRFGHGLCQEKSRAMHMTKK